MATVKKNPPPPPVQPSETYTVELSRAEARALALLLHSGVGSETLNRLGLTDLHLALLQEAGFAGRYPNTPGNLSPDFAFQNCAKLAFGVKLLDD